MQSQKQRVSIFNAWVYIYKRSVMEQLTARDNIDLQHGFTSVLDQIKTIRLQPKTKATPVIRQQLKEDFTSVIDQAVKQARRTNAERDSYWGKLIGKHAPINLERIPMGPVNPLCNSESFGKVQDKIEGMRKSRDLEMLNDLGRPKKSHMMYNPVTTVTTTMEDVLAELLTNPMFLERVEYKKQELKDRVQPIGWYDYIFGKRQDTQSWET